MYKKCISIIVFLCLLVMSNGAYGVFRDIGRDGAETRYQDDWLNDQTEIPAVEPWDSDFSRAENWGIQRNTDNRPPGTTGDYWDPNIRHRPPDMNVWACFEGKFPEPNIYEGNVACSRLSIYPWTGGTQVLGGQAFALTVGFNAGDINCGVQIGLADKEPWVSEDKGYAVLNVFGGTMFTPGYNATTDPPMYCPPSGLHIGGGPMYPPNQGRGFNYGIVNMYGGSIIVPGIQINYGEVNLLYDDVNLVHGLLYNTTADADNNFVISQAHAMDRINIEGVEIEDYGLLSGELRLKGNRRAQIDDFYDSGRLCACRGHGILFVDYNGTDTSVTAKCTPGSAWEPTPADRKSRVALNQIFSWTPGNWAQDAGEPNGTHAVYFGLDFNDVNDANDADDPCDPNNAYKGRQDANSYDPGPLPAGATCYWRIDEYNDTGDPFHPGSPWRGKVWSFQTVGGEAIDPIPESGTVGLPIPLKLSWTPGVFVATTNGHDIYFGTNEANVTADTNANMKGTYQGRQTSNVFLLSSLPYKLTADTNYYWRVDEVNGATTWKGETWNFTNTKYFIIDDFESYDSDEALLARWDTGDVYDSCPSKYPAGKIGWAYSAENGTMQFDYDNQHGSVYCGSCYFSEVRFDANGVGAGGEDWTGGGALPDDDKARVLAISYIGESRNDAGGPTNNWDPNYDRMYVAIEDTDGNSGSVVLNSELDGQRTSFWKQWEVKLTDLNSPDVNLKDVKYLYLGFGIRCNAGLQGGTGTVKFDDIRLYQRHCVPELAVGDLTSDCRVNMDDVNVFADQWLNKQTVVTPKEPCNIDPNLVLWYKFDEATGKIVHNWGFCADCNGDVNVQSGVADDSWWDTTGGYDGNGCLNLVLDSNTFVDACTAAMGFLADKNAITFSVWVNADVYLPPGGWPRLVCVFQDTNSNDSYEKEVVEIDCPVPEDVGSSPFVSFVTAPQASGAANSESMQMSDFGGGWHHYAFVKDADANFMRIYYNGGVVAEANTNPMFGFPIEAFHIGKRRPTSTEDPGWVGRMDDFRVYDYALSQEEVAWLRGTGYVPFRNVANFKSDIPDAVNFGDYAILAQKWLSEQLWP